MVTRMAPVKRLLVPALTLLLLRAVPSCSSDGATDAPPDLRLRDVPGIFASKACEVTLDCLGPVADVGALRSECVERVTRQFEDGEFALFADAIDAGRVDFDGSQVADCTERLEKAGCDLLSTRFDSVCPDLFTGHTDAGAECSVDVECQEGHYCRFGSACPGTCEPLSEAGGDCLENNDCRDGLICGRAGKCLEPSADGAACLGDSGNECAATSVCAGAAPLESGVCQSVDDAFSRDEGAECDATRGEFCKAGLVCAAIAIEDAVPVLRCEPPGDGASCHFAIPEACPEGQYCVLAEVFVPPQPPYRVELPGECQPLPAEGEPCGTVPGVVGTRCRTNAVCVAGTCRNVQRLGGNCTTGAECYSGVCTDGTCAPTLCSGAE